jgi:hypothetical protein
LLEINIGPLVRQLLSDKYRSGNDAAQEGRDMTLEIIQMEIANVVEDLKADVRFARGRGGEVEGFVINFTDLDEAGVYCFREIKREMEEAGITEYMRIASPDRLRRVYISPLLGAAITSAV